jgi:MFS transporter, ACS family, solute carrier family 17 (sodium-dependent inorganic phosphate cotransporter), member 5
MNISINIISCYFYRYFSGCAYGAGFLVNYNDIAGAYSAIVFGIGNTFATIPGIIAPYLVGIITKNVKNLKKNNALLLSSINLRVFLFFFLIFSSSKSKKNGELYLS